MSSKPSSELLFSPLDHGRRVDWRFAKAIAANAAFAVLIGTLSGHDWAPLAAGTAACVAMAAWLVRFRGGTSASAVALSALLGALAVLTWQLDPAHPALVMNLMLVVGLLPAYRRWGLVLAGGTVMAVLPLALSDASTRADALVAGALLVAQLALLVPLCRRDAFHWRALFDVDFLIRAMGHSGAIRLDLDVLRAETPIGQRLKDAQGRMAQTLRHVRRASKATQIAAAALQDSGGQLAERTELTGTELHHASMTLSQIAVIVKESADAALAARDIARAASALTHEGGEIVGQVVGQMQAIDKASRRITDIVGVIEAIAFQTNLLALNAAVEAARAGPEGRGFAVVAGEVRMLAKRAAEAAAEVKGLIENSAQAVARGNQLAAAAGKTMQALTGSVARVDEVFHGLSADTNEHAVGIEAIRDTMNELREATQRNLGVADQAREIADDLAERAALMGEAIAAFKLGASKDDEEADAATDDTGAPARAMTDAAPAPARERARAAPARAPAGAGASAVEFF